ncbi:GNAT family N-acetyltransferase [Glaciimonas soli]|uniref:GNAT family N-acetyltransferase n=1 Tax=Glaciimonas soli TaxID=2590999 RepID=A0A843YTJ6_9BURK|nr:GNAT family N-acetyltransferase [Glaciimonas soli]MQQ99975.1 GNAT family N-acetyltransferase [Glaciimonas soli]
MTLPIITTKRTILKILTSNEASMRLAFEIENKAHLSPWGPAQSEDFYTLPAMQERTEKMHQAALDGSTVYFSAIDPVTQKMMATCSFTNIIKGAFLACHLGYGVAKSHEGQGFMQEIVEAGIQYMFDEVGLHRIMANHQPSNLRSEKLLKKIGFEREGYAKSYLKINGKWEDMVLNALVNPKQQ